MDKSLDRRPIEFQSQIADRLAKNVFEMRSRFFSGLHGAGECDHRKISPDPRRAVPGVAQTV
jgi:hypothetical protein